MYDAMHLIGKANKHLGSLNSGDLSLYYNRPITNVDEKRGKKKQIWFADTAREEYEDEWNRFGSNTFSHVPSRYGPRREVIANFRTVEMADFVVALWNSHL